MMDPVRLVHAIDTIDLLFDRVCSLETSKRALTASVIRLYEQAERAEAENERLRAELRRVKAQAA